MWHTFSFGNYRQYQNTARTKTTFPSDLASFTRRLINNTYISLSQKKLRLYQHHKVRNESTVNVLHCLLACVVRAFAYARVLSINTLSIMRDVYCHVENLTCGTRPCINFNTRHRTDGPSPFLFQLFADAEEIPQAPTTFSTNLNSLKNPSIELLCPVLLGCRHAPHSRSAFTCSSY